MPKVTEVLAGITTLATFDKSGTAPPAQLVGLNQLPLLPPTHVTLFNWVMLLVEFEPSVTA